jgi:hypothetical protein
MARTGYSLAAGALSLGVGLALHALALYLRDSGPTWDALSISFRGNGALIVLLPALAALLVGEFLCLRRRAWAGALLVPAGLLAGRFVVAGSF